MSKKRRSFVSVLLIIVISFACGFFADDLVLGFFNGFTGKQIMLINSVDQIIMQTAIDDYDNNYIADYALKGMAAALNDDYAYYFTKEELAEYRKATSGTVEGNIGVTLYDDDGKIIIKDIYKGLSAESSGLKAGDRIIKVNEDSIDDLTFAEVSSQIKGDTGTSVKITVLRGDKELSFNVERKDGQRQMTEYRMIDNLLYVRIISFRANALEYFEKAIKHGEENNYQGIILDLRDNPGGELDIFASIADILLPESEVFYAKDKKGNKCSEKYSDAEYIDKPISVIVNGNSASASEAMTGSLRDIGKAYIVGTKTYGKGIIQNTFMLNNGGMFKLTTAKYYLPNGDCIHGKGITPEYVVELPEELAEKSWLINDHNDLQLKKAIEVLTKE